MLIAYAGKDISHWFNPSGDLRDRIDPVTGARQPVLPHGAMPHIPMKVKILHICP